MCCALFHSKVHWDEVLGTSWIVSLYHLRGDLYGNPGGSASTRMSKLPRGFWVGVSAQNFSPLLWHSHFVVVVDDALINKIIF